MREVHSRFDADAGPNRAHANGNGVRRWGTITVTVLLALLALATHWGAVSATLSGVKDQMRDVLAEVRLLRVDIQGLSQRVAYLEGTKVQGPKQP